jgi:two-component system sensor histidine kinase PilS (NtrC family)
MLLLARQLHWLIAIRLVVITSVVLPFFLIQIAPRTPVTVEPSPQELPAPPPALEPPGDAPAYVLTVEPPTAVDTRLLYFLAGLTYLASLVYLGLLRAFRRRYRLHAYLQFLGDLMLVTVLVYFFGGIESPFSILYLVVVAVATTLLKRRSTGVATLAFVLYAGLLVVLYQGWVPMPDGSILSQDVGTTRRLVYNLAVHLFAFYAVALLTWFLVANVARAEQELEAKAEDLADLEVKYRDVIQSISSGLLTTDREGHVTSVNRAAQQILHREEDDLVGRHVSETGIINEELWREFALESREQGRLTNEVEVVRDQAPIYVGFSIAELLNADGVPSGAIVIFQDLTPWRNLEEEVRMKDRMAAVGTLAAGLAHEIGNPLAAISGSVQMLERSVDDESPQQRLLGIVLKESQRLDRTIKGFLEYARPKNRRSVDFDVARLLAENFELLENSPEVRPDHRLELRLDPPSAHLVADPDGVSQIFWNLAKNALKAMPEGGRLRVTGALTGTGAAGSYRITFSDTGHGMTEEERANLFHPFQSFFDSGSGLGMAIVYRIVQDLGGHLSVDSRPGRNTRITVELPIRTDVAIAGAAPRAATSVGAARTAGGGGS